MKIDIKREERIGEIISNLIYLQHALLEADANTNSDKIDETIASMVKYFIDDEKGLYDYILESVPLAQDKGVYEWAFNSVYLYRKVTLEKIKLKGKKC